MISAGRSERLTAAARFVLISTRACCRVEKRRLALPSLFTNASSDALVGKHVEEGRRRCIRHYRPAGLLRLPERAAGRATPWRDGLQTCCCSERVSRWRQRPWFSRQLSAPRAMGCRAAWQHFAARVSRCRPSLPAARRALMQSCPLPHMCSWFRLKSLT